MKKIATQVLVFFFIFLIPQIFFAQGNFPSDEKTLSDKRQNFFAFTNATIFIDYQNKQENATLIIKKGKIVGVKSGRNVPEGATEIDLNGRYIYPAFIDLYSAYGTPEVKTERSWNNQPERKRKGAYSWNDAIRPETQASEVFEINVKAAQKYREMGFGAVLTHHHDGIMRGTGAVVTLGEEEVNLHILKATASFHLSFEKGSSTQNYPRSLMGAIALLRQTYYDVGWYANEGKKEALNLSLKALEKYKNLPSIFEVKSWQSFLRADKVGDEFGIQYIIKGAGDEYKRLDAIKESNAKVIIPLDFPKAYDVENPYDASVVTLEDMKHWELAPKNATFLKEAGIDFAFTSFALKDKKTFFKNLRKTIQYGLSEEEALKALTFTPAQLLKVENQIGSLKEGMVASFIITSGNIFEKSSKVLENWVQGKAFAIQGWDTEDIRGVYEVNVLGGNTFTLTLQGDIDKPKATINQNGEELKTTFIRNDKVVTITYIDKEITQRFSGWIDGEIWQGKTILTDGKTTQWSATKVGEITESTDKNQNEKITDLGKITYPFMAYGNRKLPQAQNYLIKNATVWTNEAEGIIENADVLVKDGKIVEVGQGLSAGDAIEIDGTGKHLTSGIIDEHSHIAISRGVNEGTDVSSAEVRIGDVINSEDINIYRQLAGGVTVAQLLHGSANPIGGQSAFIKLRWGATPEEMKIEGAVGFIKFALGENVKQSNWGRNYSSRYPQTRMGVEQVFVDYFTRAKEYKKSDKKRRDLDLETVAEIIDKERFITCHSYVQSEIIMLMRVAEDFNFTINTFTHILEGYKVADEMYEHGAGGSSFADWWAYKFEVKDAIAYNSAILSGVGVLTAINSDDAEMARRLNQEASKVVKYGGVSQEDAWKMVTLNPAQLLHLEDRMGSIKKGKDADLVLWSNNPLSIYAIAEKTFVDGILYFDIELQEQILEEMKAERNRLIQKMIAAKKSGVDTQKPIPKKQKMWHCDDVDDVFKYDFISKYGY